MKNLSLKIYNSLPFFLQKILFRFKSKQKYRFRLSGKFEEYYKQYNALWKADIDTVKNYQKEQLKELLSEAFHYTQWYSEIFRQQGISAKQISENPFNVLSKLPFLEKGDIRENLEKIVSSNPEQGASIPNFTSGTTGTPMKTLASADSERRLHAVKKRFHTVSGVPFKNRCVRFSGNQIISPSRKKPPFWQYNSYENVWFFSLYHYSKENLPAYIDKLNEIRPHLMDGYPSGIFVLANYIINNNIQLSFTPNAICTTAEPLTQVVRERIEKAFGCKVFNQYSSSEGATFITECSKGNLHVNMDTGLAEYINKQGKAGSPGEICELVITGFINKKTPLIRYRTGDKVKLAAESTTCTCGCNMPVIEEIYGRFEDYLVDEKGIEQGMVSYRTFKLANNIIKAQIIQKELKSIQVSVVKDSGYTQKDEQFIISKIHAILGRSIDVHVEYCDDIPAGANGKFKTVIKDF